VLEGDAPRWTPIIAEDGTPLRLKAEGLALDDRDPSRAWIVLDLDDPDAATELCRLELAGPW
jgi:hypothetical protein